MKNIPDTSPDAMHDANARTWQPKKKLMLAFGAVAGAAALIVGGLALADATPVETVDIADVPVATFADQSKPNVMLILDTSGSMRRSHMPDDWEPANTSSNLFSMGYKSSLCNPLYYNPNTVYTLPKAPNGSDLPMPSFTAAKKDGYNLATNAPVVDLSLAFQAYDADTRDSPLYNDTPQPAYYFAWVKNTAAGTRPDPVFEALNDTVGACNKVPAAYPKTRFDDGTQTQGEAMPGVAPTSTTAGTPAGYWLRTPITGADQQQNFAIWYSYYRTRLNMAKSSVSLAFASLSDNFRVGFLTAANPDPTKPYSKFMPVKDFGGTDKEAWFTAIQGIQTGLSSPTREALARVGRYYSGKSDSINSSMTPFVDPVISACQRHYAIVTTDGYWNPDDETRGPVQIDGVTPIGQQDGPPLALTGADGLIPRPVYDASTSGYKLVRDATVTYSTAPCQLGWNVTTPAAGTKKETIYKKIIEKDVMTATQKVMDFTWWKKSTRTIVQRSGKITDWNFPKSKRSYWYAQGTSTVTKTRYRQQSLWTEVIRKKYRYKATTTWVEQTQTPYSKSVAQKAERLKYFYWYRDPSMGEVRQKTTDKTVCQAFPSGCTLQGNDTQWEVVQSCPSTLSGTTDSDGFKYQCRNTEVAVSWTTYCPAKNNQYVAGIGTIQCKGSNIPAYTGAVPSCNVIHPTLSAAITAAGGQTGNVIYSACTNKTETAYVPQTACVAVTAADATNGYKRTTCAEEIVSTGVDNSCPDGFTDFNASSMQYESCTKRQKSEWVATCVAGPLPETSARKEYQCAQPTLVDTTTVSSGACPGTGNTGYTVQCSSPPVTTWSGPVQQESTACINNTTQGKVCAIQYGGYVPTDTCTAIAPNSTNGWIGTECAEASQGTACTPAAGTENNPVPPNQPVNPGTCVNQSATPANGCIYTTCETNTTGPDKVPTCTNVTPASPTWQQVSCVAANEPVTPVQSCTGNGTNAANCRDFVVNTDMAPGTCDAAVANLPGAGQPSAQNNWTTTTCTKVDASTNGGLTYLQSAADFAAQCQQGTSSSGVITTCTKEETTVAVPEGQLCVPGYDPVTHKVTDCSGIGNGHTELVTTQPASCPAATCQIAWGNKKVFAGTAWTNKVNLTGTAAIGNPTLVNPPGNQTISGDLESPSVCYPASVLSAGATLTQPPNNRPVPGTQPWAALPSTHQSCTRLPCDDVVQSSVTAGSSNSLADVAQYYYATDLRPGDSSATPRGWNNLVKPAGTGAEDDRATWQHMSTYVIGMGVSGTLKYDKDYKNGAGDFAALRTGAAWWPLWPPNSPTSNFEQPQSIDDFWHTAVNGRGRYFSANDPKSIETGLGQVFADIRSAIGSGAGVAVTSAVVGTGDNYAYGAMYRSGSWYGDVLAYEISVTGGARTQVQDWSAKAKLDSRNLSTDDRTIYFMDATKTLQPFSWSSMSSAQQDNFRGAAAEAKLAQTGQMSAAQKTAAMGKNLVNFLRGDRSAEGFLKNDVTKLYRTRDSRLGDIIGSQPLYISKPRRLYKDEGYTSYRLAQKDRKPMVYVGSNDGMLHAFYAETDLTKTITVNSTTRLAAAREAWAFVPTAMMAEMPRLASTDYESAHRYFVDGSPVTADIKVGNTWKTIIVGGFNKGGKGYYALDVTNPEAPVALWESTLSTMGMSYGKPLISKLPNGTWAVFLTSGYNNSDGVGRVYVLNANTGAVIQTIATTGSGLKELNNFVKDPAGDNTTSLFYGGDMQGNVWRFQWTGTEYSSTKVVQLTDASGNAQPITTRIELVAGKAGSTLPRILVATGKLLGIGDLAATTKVQSVYGFEDALTGYATGASLRASLKHSELTNVAAVGLAPMTRTLKCTSATADCNDDSKGWYIDLPDSGERVNVDMRMAGSTLVVSSNVPSTEPCVSGGTGWVNYLNYQTGRAVNEGTNKEGPAGVSVNQGLIMGNDLSSTPDGKVTSHVTPSTFPDKPIDIPIPTASPKPKGKRISWRELMQ